MKRPAVLLLIPLGPETLSALRESFELIESPSSRGAPALETAQRDAIVAVVTNGTTGCGAALMAQLPHLKVIAAFGAGHEGVDVAAAHARGVQVANAPGANAPTVADHAVGLALAVARDTCARSAAVHAGGWDEVRSARPTLNGASVGILGMGQIGRLVAQRVEAFGARVAYHGRSAQPALARYDYCDTAEGLAQRSDFLFATCPGGPATHHLVGARVLQALGPQGFLVNVARGSVVDTAALVEALGAGTIAGAALDVVEEEPELPAALLGQRNLVLSPHMAGRSPAALKLQTEMMLANLAAGLRGEPCPNSVA